MAAARSNVRRRRSTPQQQRSRLMVERILEAGRVVLIEYGYDGATTNRIAAAAGVSPGSLYQYFPNKEAIIAEVVVRYTDQITSRVSAHLTAHLGEPDESGNLRETLGVLLEAMDEQPELLRALIEHTPRLGLGDKIAAFEQRVGEIGLAHVRLRAQPLKHAGTTIWLLVRTVEHLTIRYLLDRPPIDRDEFVDELSALVLNHLLSQANSSPAEPSTPRHIQKPASKNTRTEPKVPNTDGRTP
jgi:AcrR family transcriptional regulator